MRIPEDKLEEIKSKVNIVDVVSQYVKLEKRGNNYVGLCPFHDEKTPSFSVNEQKQLFHCFGCKNGGSIFSFIQKNEGIDFPEAVMKIAKEYNIELPDNITSNTPDISTEEIQMIKLHEVVRDHLHFILMNTKEAEPALEYLYTRGFTDEMLSELKIGVTINHPSYVATFIKEETEFEQELAYLAGVISKNEETNQYYDYFRNRIIFPLNNHKGQPVGFSGRTYSNEEPKYLNSKETPLFQKRKMLYNLHGARKAIRDQDEVIVAEGFMDVIKINKATQNVVATMGTALTKDHINALKRLTNHITLLYDGDRAGIEASYKSSELIMSEQLNPYIIRLKDGLDPDEFIESKGVEAFNSFIKHHKTHYLIQKVNDYEQEIHDNDVQFERIYNEITSEIPMIKSSVLREKVIKHVSSVFQIDVQTITQSLPVFHQSNNEQEYYNVPVEQSVEHDLNRYLKQNPYARSELMLLKYMTTHLNIFEQVRGHIDEADFMAYATKDIFNDLNRQYDNHKQFDLSETLTHLQKIDEHYADGRKSLTKSDVLLLMDQMNIPDEPTVHEVEDYIHQIVSKRSLEEKYKALQFTLSQMDNSEIELVSEYVQKMIDIQKQLKEDK